MPGFLDGRSDVAFALHAARFHAAAAAGDGVGALQLARAELAPRAQACPHLLPKLKVRCPMRIARVCGEPWPACDALRPVTVTRS